MNWNFYTQPGINNKYDRGNEDLIVFFFLFYFTSGWLSWWISSIQRWFSMEMMEAISVSRSIVRTGKPSENFRYLYCKQALEPMSESW